MAFFNTHLHPAATPNRTPAKSVRLTAQSFGNMPTVQRINAGRNGFALPY